MESVGVMENIYKVFDPEMEHEIEAAWAKEADIRISKYIQGETKTVLTEDVFNRIKKDSM